MHFDSLLNKRGRSFEVSALIIGDGFQSLLKGKRSAKLKFPRFLSESYHKYCAFSNKEILFSGIFYSKDSSTIKYNLARR